MNADSTPSDRVALLFPGLLLTALWLLLCWSLSAYWSVNPQYSFGWLVPPFALYLGARRWSTRPAPQEPANWAWSVLILSALTFLPAWLLTQPNPDWRLVNWLLAVEVVMFTIGIAARLGGTAWARHFAMPIGLILLAVPWPSTPEAQVIGSLMHAVAGATVTLLNFCGIPALQHGNLIEIHAGMLGVDEACSGVRSLQATLMAAVALGELYRFPISKRFILVLASVGVALVTNTGRALLLAWNAAHSGLEAVNRWHDPAGFTVMTICFLLVWGIALLLGRDHREPPPTRITRPSHVIPHRVLAGFTGWFLVAIVGTELWFATSPANTAKGSPWRFVWPQAGDTRELSEIPIAARASEMLHFDEGRGMSWTDEQGERWLAYHLRWNAGPSRSRILARMHRPEHCLPSTGWQLVQERDTIYVPIGNATLPFRTQRFTQGERSIHIWFCTAQDYGSVTEESARWLSLQAVLRRERNLGQQVLEVALFSAISGAEADAEFQREIVPRLQATVPK